MFQLTTNTDSKNKKKNNHAGKVDFRSVNRYHIQAGNADTKSELPANIVR